MTNSVSKKDNVFLFSILIIATSLLFRKIATVLIIMFLLYMFVNRKYFFKNNASHINLYIAIISIPLLLELLFFFMNDNLMEGYKSLEKSISSFLIPFVFLFNYKLLYPEKMIKRYAVLTLLLLVVFLLGFIVFRHDYFMKYLNGIHLWEMGYEFSNFIGIHAPALNMYISLITIYFLYAFITEFKQHKLSKKSTLFFLFFLISFCFLLIINTRIALFTFLINLIILFFTFDIQSKIKVIVFSVSFGFSLFLSLLFVYQFPYTVEKYTTQITDNLDKIGKLDEIPNPEATVYSSLVTRLSIWKSAVELGNQKFFTGYGSSDAKTELIKYYGKTNQHFLKKYGLITHNQFLNYFLKYGIIGFICCLIYLCYPLYIFIQTKKSMVLFFFVNFFISNCTDDYLNKFDGIVYSAIWYSIFTYYLIQKKND
jgi:O-antigen ligase